MAKCILKINAAELLIFNDEDKNIGDPYDYHVVLTKVTDRFDICELGGIDPRQGPPTTEQLRAIHKEVGKYYAGYLRTDGKGKKLLHQIKDSKKELIHPKYLDVRYDFPQ